jgi:hypothetical protein
MEINKDLLMDFINDFSRETNYNIYTSENMKAELKDSVNGVYIWVVFYFPSQPSGLKLNKLEEWDGSATYIFTIDMQKGTIIGFYNACMRAYAPADKTFLISDEFFVHLKYIYKNAFKTDKRKTDKTAYSTRNPSREGSDDETTTIENTD